MITYVVFFLGLLFGIAEDDPHNLTIWVVNIYPLWEVTLRFAEGSLLCTVIPR